MQVYAIMQAFAVMPKGGENMKMERVVIQLPARIKAKLDSLRAQGYTAAGYIRTVLEHHFDDGPRGKKGR